MEVSDGLNVAWERIGRIRADQLAGPRRHLHRAAQFPAAMGRSLARSKPQHTNRALWYRGSIGALVSREAAATGVYLGLAVAEGRLVFVGPGGGIVDSLRLHGHPRDEIWEWLETMLEETGTDGRTLDREHPEYNLADHPVAEGDSFELAHLPACAELARHLANAHRLLAAVGVTRPQTTPVRTWPDSFETSLYTNVDPRKRMGRGEFVEFGFSAGDGTYEEPYWYVAPHPHPNPEQVPAVEGEGFWHREDWVGAVLPVSRLYNVDDQIGRVTSFLDEHGSVAEQLVEARVRRGAE